MFFDDDFNSLMDSDVIYEIQLPLVKFSIYVDFEQN